MSVVQTVDEVRLPGPVTARADRQVTRKTCLGARREGRDFLISDVNPFELGLSPQRVGQPVQTITNNAINPLHTCRRENLGELICYCSDHTGSCQYRRTIIFS